MNETVAAHCGELERCNQRGGRMLSVFDLLAAQTLDLELAAFLMARIFQGASFMVGARPGGAGKTTVMCALLNLAPLECELIAATGSAVRHPRNSVSARACYICHEIGAGHFFAYLWGADLRAYCALADQGHLLATNLHADDIEEARDQVCGENKVSDDHFNAFDLLIFLRVAGRYYDSRRWIDKVYISNGKDSHELVFDAKTGLRAITPEAGDADSAFVEECRRFLRAGAQTGLQTIEETRSALYHWADSF